MRNIQLYSLSLLLAASAWGQTAEPFNAARVTPSWNRSGGIDLYVSNTTKMPLSTDRLAVELRLKTEQPCRLNYERRLDLKPGETVKLAIAGAPAARKCFESQGAASARALRSGALRFEHPPFNAAPQLAAPKTDAVVISAAWKLHGRVLRSQSYWLVKPAGP